VKKDKRGEKMETDSYYRPESLEEAHELLQQEDVAVVGGGAFLRLSQKHFSKLLDLSKLDLDYIRETRETIEIGAYTTLRSLETSSLLAQWTDGIVSASEQRDTRKVLNAAALTYVAGAFMMVMMLLRYILLFMSLQRRR